MFYFYTFIYSLKRCFKPEFPSSAKHKRYFEEGGKPNSCWSTVFPAVKVSVDQQLFGYPDSSKLNSSLKFFFVIIIYLIVLRQRVSSISLVKSTYHFLLDIEVLKNTYHRGQNRTLIKYKSKLYYLQITIVALDSYLWQ